MNNQIDQLKQQFTVQYTYNVDFSETVFAIENSTLENYICTEKNTTPSPSSPKKILIIIDEAVHLLHSNLKNKILDYFQKRKDRMRLVNDPIIITGGEACKNDIKLVTRIYQLVSEKKICRHSYLIVVGGGSLIDMVGYAAATAHRGIRLIRIPTTFLAQADASIGVKNSINLFAKKNFIGTFSTPYAVINDYQFLLTLPENTLREGLSEAIKVALIKDKDFFFYIYENIEQINHKDETVLKKIIYECARLHLDHITNNGDPFEKGSSRPLDFGHWSAHKIEQLSNHKVTHGQAVAIGIALDCMYAFLSGYLAKDKLELILNLFLKINLKIFDKYLLTNLAQSQEDNVLKGLTEFQEHLGGELTILLLKDICEAFEVHSIDQQTMITAIQHLKEYQEKFDNR